MAVLRAGNVSDDTGHWQLEKFLDYEEMLLVHFYSITGPFGFAHCDATLAPNS